jgi:hypothetical protein
MSWQSGHVDIDTKVFALAVVLVGLFIVTVSLWFICNVLVEMKWI